MLQRLHEPVPELIFVHEPCGDAAILHVFDEVDVATADQLRAAIASVETAGPVIIDLRECRFIDSSVLSVFVRSYRTLGRRLRIVVSEGSHIRRVFAVTGLIETLGVVSTLDEALTAA